MRQLEEEKTFNRITYYVLLKTYILHGATFPLMGIPPMEKYRYIKEHTRLVFKQA